MSMDPRSVGMVAMLLNAIFTISDADYLASSKEKQLDVILKKFKGLQLLEKTLLVPASNIVRYSSSTICGKITYLSMLQGDSLCVIDDFIGYDFFCNYVLPRSWYYLLNKKKITYDKLKESLLKDQYNGIALTIEQLRN